MISDIKYPIPMVIFIMKQHDIQISGKFYTKYRSITSADGMALPQTQP